MRRFLLCGFLLCFVLSAVPAAQVAAGIIRVRWDSASDGPGHDWEHAYRKVADAIAASAAGDEIWVSGASSHPYFERITLRAGVGLYGGFAGVETSRDARDVSANVTILDGGASGTIVTSPSGADSSTIVDGFTLRNAGGSTSNSGVWCQNSSPAIRNNTITQTGTGIRCSTSSPEITHNTIFNGGGITCQYSSAPLVAYNVISGTSSGIFCDSSSPTIMATVISDCGTGIYLNYESSPDISGCVISTSGASGIYASFYCAPNITNNTIVGNATNGIECFKLSSPSVSNNIVAFNGTGITSAGAPALTSNCFYTPGGSDYSGVTPGAGDINANPLFVNRAGGDYHLLAGSPCIDAGSDAQVPSWLLTDLDGAPRISGPHVDMGAFEFQAASVADARGSKDGAEVSLSGVTVTAAWPDVFYVEQPDRACGIRVSRAAHGLQVGQTAAVTGTMATTADGERMIEASAASATSGEQLAALGMKLGSLGGSATPDYLPSAGTGQQGVAGGTGLNNIGLLVKVFGTVQHVDSAGGFFVVSDGSRVSDAEGRAGVRVVAPGLIPSGLAPGEFTAVTGISSCCSAGGVLYSRILVRSPADIVRN